jgi:PAS domain-containing protein
MENSLKLTITLFKPAFEVSLDAIAVIDEFCRVRYANGQMRSLLGLTARELSHAPIFCDCITLAACQPKCELQKVIDSGKGLRLDESPAERGDNKMRITLKAAPLYYPGKQKGPKPLGAIVTARETTGEILLQAKYHRAMLLLEEKDQEILELADKLRSKEETLRRSRP